MTDKPRKVLLRHARTGRTLWCSAQAWERTYRQEIDPSTERSAWEFDREATDADYSSPANEPADDGDAVRPAGNASRDTWADYVVALGGDPGELGRDELVDLAGELEAGE